MEKYAVAILIIDPNSRALLSKLRTSGRQEGFEFYATESVAEGLDFLKSYAATLNAILLGIKFPQEPNQGAEVLSAIKIEHPNIPVILLTEGNTAHEISLVSELMKMGAYNYVAKKGLNQTFLHQVISAAIQNQQLQSQLLSKSYPKERKTSFFIVKNDCNIGRFQRKACFGFDLVSVNKPANEQDEKQMIPTALDWHENLLKSISFIYRDELQINLKFIAQQGMLRCCILFSVFATGETALEQVLENIQQDTSVFFSGLRPDGSNPYIFEIILDKEFLSSIQEYPSAYQYHLFYRKPLKIKKEKSIGFSSQSKNVVSEKSGQYLPDEIFPVPMTFDNDNEIFRALHNRKDYTEIDVLLMPKQLFVEEIDLIRRIINNSSVIEPHSFSPEEIQFYISYLKKFIVTPNDKFMVSVLLKTKGSNSGQHLTTGVKNYFFGSRTEVGNKLRKPDRLFRFCKSDSGRLNQLPFYYSIQEVLQVFRLPLPGLIDLPGITEQSSAFNFIPDNLSGEGLQLGEKSGMNGKKAIRISSNALARHLYIMGQTGTGKSTLLKTMIKDALEKNIGFTLIDPHGDLYDDVYSLIPNEKKRDIVIIDTSNPDNSYAFNPLLYEKDKPYTKSLIINEIIRAFLTVYQGQSPEAFGPSFDSMMRNALLLVMDEGNPDIPKLLDVKTLFHNERYRAWLLLNCKNKEVKNFFEQSSRWRGEQDFENWAMYITAKLTRFIDDYFMRNILCNTGDRQVNFREIMDENKILLVKMDKGLIGADNSSLLGQLIISNLSIAAMSRSNINVSERKQYILFIDEFQNFIRSDVSSALSEVRKYGLSLIMANQTMAQLSKEMRDSLLGNAGSMIFFRPGVSDYETIKYYVEPEFKREDVLKLPNFNCIARLQIDHIPSDPFVFQTKRQ